MKPTTKPEAITPAQYRAFQDAYDFFNQELFGGTLPHVLVTLQRHANSRGYFAPERFAGRKMTATAHELAMNPDTFNGRSDRDIASTLAHEMVHVWQQTYGKPSRSGYHNKEWAAKMKLVGLYPSDTGEPGGKEVGQQMTHYIVAGGAFDRAFDKLSSGGFALHWQSNWPGRTKGPGGSAVSGFGGDPDGQQAKAKKASKTKFTCPDCAQNAWAKPDAELICGNCYGDENTIVLMMAEEQPESQADAA